MTGFFPLGLFSKFTHVIAYIITSFLFMPLYGHTTFYLSIQQLMDICIVSTVLSIMNNAARNVHVQVFV